MTSHVAAEQTQRQQTPTVTQPLSDAVEVTTVFSPLAAPPPSTVQTAALGPLDSMGVPDEVFLADKTEADQCLITITGAYIRVCQAHNLTFRLWCFSAYFDYEVLKQAIHLVELK